jgi:hypothetical protein
MLATLLADRVTLAQATSMNREGRITDEVYRAYCHEWQTSAPRFEIQACACESCVRDHAPIK